MKVTDLKQETQAAIFASVSSHAAEVRRNATQTISKNLASSAAQNQPELEIAAKLGAVDQELQFDIELLMLQEAQRLVQGELAAQAIKIRESYQ